MDLCRAAVRKSHSRGLKSHEVVALCGSLGEGGYTREKGLDDPRVHLELQNRKYKLYNSS